MPSRWDAKKRIGDFTDQAVKVLVGASERNAYHITYENERFIAGPIGKDGKGMQRFQIYNLSSGKNFDTKAGVLRVRVGKMITSANRRYATVQEQHKEYRQKSKP